MNKVDRFLRLMNDRGASDFHLTVGRPPMLRASGSMEAIRYRMVTEAGETFDIAIPEFSLHLPGATNRAH